MGLLSARCAATLHPLKDPAGPGGIAQVVGRDIRARVEGNREGQSTTCLSPVTMSRSGDPPTSCRGARGNSGSEEGLAVEVSTRSCTVYVLQPGCSRKRWFTPRGPIFALFSRTILDLGAPATFKRRHFTLSYPSRACPHLHFQGLPGNPTSI